MKTVVFIRGTGIFDDSRATKEIMALVEAGYYVEVIGWDRHGGAAQRCKEAFTLVADSVHFSFFEVRAENGIGLKNIDKMIGWISWILKTLNKLDGIYVVHACDLDAGIAAYSFCARRKVKLIYDIFDYYIDCHHIPAVLRSCVERMEISIINFADVTIICTDERREQIAQASPRKVIVIHNTPDIKQCLEVHESVDYVYCGVMPDRRLVEEILFEYEKHTELKFSFAGYGPYAQKAASLAQQYDNFNFMGVIPYSEVLSLEKQARVLSAIYEPVIRNHRLCAPNKFYESLALGKPVIVCRGTGIDKIVEQNNIGAVIDYDASQFYAAVRKLTADEQLRKEMGSRARALYEKKYNWDIMKRVLLDAYEALSFQ